jgi:hypothetical protein
MKDEDGFPGRRVSAAEYFGYCPDCPPGDESALAYIDSPRCGEWMACKAHHTRWWIGYGRVLAQTPDGKVVEELTDEPDPDWKLWRDLGVESFADVKPLFPPS